MKTVHINGYRNNIRHQRPRQPLVHLMGYESDGGDLQSLTFTPKEADILAARLKSAARRVRSGNDYRRSLACQST